MKHLLNTFIIATSFSTALILNAQPAADAPRVQTVRPQPAVASNITLTARTAPAESAFVYARATGTVAERRVDLGDRVVAGDILAVIAAPEIAHQVARARAALAQAEAEAELAELNGKRARQLRASGGLSSETAEERETRVRVSIAEAAAARAELARLEEIAGFQTIRAPFAGVIAERRIDRGDRVSGDQSAAGAWLFHLVRLDELRVAVDAPPAQALALAAEAKAQLTFPEFPGENFPTQLARRAQFIDPESGTVRLEFSLANPDHRLPAGLTGALALAPSSAAALTLPVNALVVRDGRAMVAVVVEGKLRFMSVQKGRNLGMRVEILGGLAPDAAVVVSPNSLLREGDHVSGPASAATRG